MIIIALTGSLATGKSTVSNLLRAPPYSLPIIDADLLARQVVEPGSAGYRQVVTYFGPSTPDLLLQQEDGGGEVNGKGRPLNRAALGRRVFGGEAERQRDRKVLNGIIHPLVRKAMLRAVLHYHVTGHWAVVLDVPLLYESGLDVFASVVVMVAVRDPEVQMRRLRERDKGLTEQEARDRVGSQMGVGEKVERTEQRGNTRGKVVLNDQGKDELKDEVYMIVREIWDESGGELWRWWLWQSPLGVLAVALWEMWCGWGARRGWEGEKAREKAKL